jgi:UDP-N-acetylmuramoylalanine--D-glutamate ligase
VTEPDFSSAKTAILGLGREGRAAWRFLRARYPEMELTLIDEGSVDASVGGLLSDRDHLVHRPLSSADLERYGILVRSPGISPYRECLRRAAEAGVIITTPSNLWFAGHSDQKTVCVTGTKGKSTTSALLAHVLRQCGFSVRLAGNIGRPLLDCDDHDVDWWVIELSSYQLADLRATPSLAVMLNLSPEHLDWHGDAETYRRDKLRLAALAGENPVVCNAADPELRSALTDRRNVIWFNTNGSIRVEGRQLFEGDRAIPVTVPEGLPGSHNLSNLAAVLTVAGVIGVDVVRAAAEVASFRPLPHRLQVLGSRDGVLWVNDSISSTPVATVAALETFAGRPVTLIVGGLDRGLEWTPYLPAFAHRTPFAVIAMPDSGQRIVAELGAGEIRPVGGFHEAADLAAAVELARRVSPRGAVVLLSPGAPSFPRFRDYRDRGRQFAACCGLEIEEFEPA